MRKSNPTMTLRNWKPAILLGIALLLGVLTASVSQAQTADWRCDVRDHADNVVDLARAARKETLHIAKYSQNLGPMLSEIAVLESHAAVLKAWAKHRDACYLVERAELAHDRVHRLDSQLEVAVLRSNRGLDRTLVSPYYLQEMIGQMEAEITHALQDIPQTVSAPAVVYAPAQPVVIAKPAVPAPPATIQFQGRRGIQIQLRLGDSPGVSFGTRPVAAAHHDHHPSPSQRHAAPQTIPSPPNHSIHKVSSRPRIAANHPGSGHVNPKPAYENQLRKKKQGNGHRKGRH